MSTSRFPRPEERSLRNRGRRWIIWSLIGLTVLVAGALTTTLLLYEKTTLTYLCLGCGRERHAVRVSLVGLRVMQHDGDWRANAISDVLCVPESTCLHDGVCVAAGSRDFVGNRLYVAGTLEARRFEPVARASLLVSNSMGAQRRSRAWKERLQDLRLRFLGTSTVNPKVTIWPHLGTALELARTRREVFTYAEASEMREFLREAVLQITDEDRGVRAVSVLRFPPVAVPLLRQVEGIFFQPHADRYAASPADGVTVVSLDRLGSSK